MNTAWTIEVLMQKLRDQDQFVRIHAATLLGLRGDEAEPAVPALVELLENGNIHDRRLAALTLMEIGPAAEEAVPSLLEATDDEDEGVVEMALAALEAIDGLNTEEEAA